MAVARSRTSPMKTLASLVLSFLALIFIAMADKGSNFLGTSIGRRVASPSASIRSVAVTIPRAKSQQSGKCGEELPIIRRRTIPGLFVGPYLTQMAYPMISRGKSRSEVSLLSEPISDPHEILRRAIPVKDPVLDSLQSKLFSMQKGLGGWSSRQGRDSNTMIGTTGIEMRQDRKVSSPGELREMVREAASILNSQQEYLVTLPPENGKAKMVNAMNSLDQHLEALKSKLNGGSESGATVEEIYHLQQNALHSVSQMKTASVHKFPFEIPKEYASHERLLGRATAEVRVRTTPPGERPKTVTMELTIDGYNAPITAGRFVSLAKKGFYDDMEIQRSDGFIVQTGDAKKKVAEQIPLEIKVETQKLPIYEYTLESVSRFDEPVTLPFNALGTLAMSRNIDDPNSADTQIFWLLKDNDMTPSGTNVLDGRFAVFGYTTKNNDALRELRVGDKIESVRITSGLEHFKGGE